MTTCPSGHESAGVDFCDVCGIRIAAAAFSETGAAPAGVSPDYEVPPAAAPDEVCPRCGISRTGQFCEACGYPGTDREASTTYQGLADDVKPGDRILIDDGNVQLDVTGKTGTRVRTRVEVGGKVSDHKGINLPGVAVSVPR